VGYSVVFTLVLILFLLGEKITLTQGAGFTSTIYWPAIVFLRDISVTNLLGIVGLHFIIPLYRPN
jgi:hypothetical protein